jgi:hypothetical protein
VPAPVTDKYDVGPVNDENVLTAAFEAQSSITTWRIFSSRCSGVSAVSSLKWPVRTSRARAMALVRPRSRRRPSRLPTRNDRAAPTSARG